MTRRDRLEAKRERRAEWAEKAKQRSAQRFGAAARIADQIPLGQPILVGHHSEKHARRDADRIHTNLSKGVQEADLAARHQSKGAGLEAQLERSVFSDDADAIEQLEARIADRVALVARRKAINKAIRKGTGWEATLTPPLTPAEKEELVRVSRVWAGFPPYVFTNLSASIRRDRQRIEEIRRRLARNERAEEAAGGVLIEGTGEYVRVTFAEKPDRAILDALKAAGFSWGNGSWAGRRDKLESIAGINIEVREGRRDP